VDPNAKIIGGNLDYHSGVTNGWQYIQGMYDNGAGPYIDGIAIHPYGDPIHWQAITDTRNVMVANGDADKGIWINEYGWNSGSESDLANKLVAVLTELKKPQWSFVVQANYLVLNDGSGVENYGLMDANLNPRLRYYAFRDFDKTFPDYVNFSADVTTGPAPLTVQFTDESTVAGASAWLWEFGDGLTSTAQSPTHIYAADGSYTVRLTVTGTDGPFTEEKADYIKVGVFPPVAGVDNPSFEANGGSYDGWEIVHVSGEGPDNPPLDNTNPWGPRTTFGTHFGGKITNGLGMNFYLGQVVGTTNWDPAAAAADWQVSAWVQLNCMQSGSPVPSGVHQVWEIGWNEDGSEPTSIMNCDHYQVVADIDGSYTDNDEVTFSPLSGSGTITGVTGLRGIAVRVRLYNDASYWWTLDNIDNLDVTVTSVPPLDVASTPAGYYQPGWNLTSVPITPADPDPNAVFQDLRTLGNIIDYNLYRYSPSTGYEVYPLGFADMVLGRGHWLWLTAANPATIVSVSGTLSTADVSVPLDQGWSLIGHPFPDPVPLAACQVTDGVTTLSFADAVTAGWVDGTLYYWEPTGGYRVANVSGYGHDNSLRPWRGYWISASGPGLQLIVPAPG
jgi:PKD repeat protein